MVRRLLAPVALILATAGVMASEVEPRAVLIDFEIADQLGKSYSNEEYVGRGLVILASDRKGSRYNPIWGKAIDQRLEQEGLSEVFAVLGMANMKGVPKFLRNMIRGKFPKDENKRVLLDWEGLFETAYGFEKKVSNILVFDPSHQLVFRTTGTELDSRKLENLIDAVAAQPVE